MKIAVVGSRSFDDYPKLSSVLDLYRKECSLIVSGGARGADSLAERYANENDLKTKIFLPDWKMYGAKAGFIRNELIVKECDFLIAFWDGKSSGTKNSMVLADRYGKRSTVIFYGEEGLFS